METDLAGQFAELEKENQRLRAELKTIARRSQTYEGMLQILDQHLADPDAEKGTDRVRLWSGPKEQVERLLAFVCEQDCCCVNEFGQNRTDGPCERCKVLGEDGRKKSMLGKLTLEEAQRTNCCRICGESIHAPFLLNYGKEFAHENCLKEKE